MKISKIEVVSPGCGMRSAHLLAIAPNANSGILLGTSPSIEPYAANAYVHRTRAGSFPVQNQHLVALLEKKGKNDKATWKSIVTNKGSVQHLDFLSPEEKSVFKTAYELDQKWVILHAADRQPFICQGQSVNLFCPAGYDRNKFSYLHWLAWKKGLKSLYYVRTAASKRADNVGEVAARYDLTTFKKKPIHKRLWHRLKSAFPARVNWEERKKPELSIDVEKYYEEEAKIISRHEEKADAEEADAKNDIWREAEVGAESSCAACEG